MSEAAIALIPPITPLRGRLVEFGKLRFPRRAFHFVSSARVLADEHNPLTERVVLAGSGAYGCHHSMNIGDGVFC
jgi:hypothetical protein